MVNPVRIKGANLGLGADQKQYQTLYGLQEVRTDIKNFEGQGIPTITVAFELMPDEIDRLTKGATLRICILGTNWPPVNVSVGDVPDDDD